MCIASSDSVEVSLRRKHERIVSLPFYRTHTPNVCHFSGIIDIIYIYAYRYSTKSNNNGLALCVMCVREITTSIGE